ncbi:hypothetical protein EDB80DRAFT_727860 [Ilyonectria destructans]|nr:hypothetical protein EDB80DRAFT_727860 [Ilyonectria destructans]
MLELVYFLGGCGLSCGVVALSTVSCSAAGDDKAWRDVGSVAGSWCGRMGRPDHPKDWDVCGTASCIHPKQALREGV